MKKFKFRVQMLVGHIHALRKGGLTKEEIRNDAFTRKLLDRMFEDAWKACEKADKILKETAES